MWTLKIEAAWHLVKSTRKLLEVPVYYASSTVYHFGYCFILDCYCYSLQKKYQTKNYSAQSIEAVKELDTVLAQLAVSE